MSRPLLQIIVASSRPGRIGLPIARWVESRAAAHDGFDVELVDLGEVNLPMFDEPSHPRLANYEHDHTKAWSATIRRADAFVFVMPEYNHGFNAALKNAIDFLWQEWNHKPVGFVSYGGVAAGTRAVGLLKPVLAAVQLVPVIQGVPIPFAATRISDDGFTSDERLDGAADTMFDALTTMVTTLAPLRQAS
jgi:NAD(P)H-dependent FMN reductase